MRTSFRDRTVWVTGASSGIGEALAREFAARGARLLLSGRKPLELERVRATCAHVSKHACVPFDLSRVEDIPQTVEQTLQRFGPVDILVNNAGVGQRGLALNTSLSVERALLEIDYFAPVTLTKAVLPGMIARKSGHVVVVSSVMGYVGTPGRSTYAAAKHALHGYFDSLRAEVCGDGIQVTLACPGYVRTRIGVNALGPAGEVRAPTEAGPNRGITAERCARGIVRGVAAGRREVYVGGPEVLGIYLQRLFPALFARVARKMAAPATQKGGV